MTTSISDLRQELVDPTARLIEFLRRLASARHAVVLDVDDNPSVLWLAQRPVAADVDTLAVAEWNAAHPDRPFR